MVGSREVPELGVRKLEMSRADPLGVLAVGLAVITTEVEDIDAGGAGGKV
jgi:hypothetical protein